jgi:hypothetical protein|nr:MAG TPA: hypothetical protein [Caudoviricetes sp.]
MGKFIELEFLTTLSEWDKNPMLLDISQVSVVLCNHGMYRVYIGSTRFDLTEDSYNKLCSALKEYKESSESIICNLQHDHTWIKQAVCNLIAMMKKDNTSYKPALLIGCNDKDLDTLFSDCYDKVRKMQERIKELEKQVEIMTEPKKGG